MRDNTENACKGSRALVVSSATGYTADALEPFLRSLYGNCSHATVVLIVNRQDREFERALKHFHRNVVLITQPDSYLRELVWSRHFQDRHELLRKPVMYASAEFLSKLPILGPQFKTCFVHIKYARYFFAQQLLLDRYKNADPILLCDSRDVFFQDDPFRYLQTDLVTGLEDSQVKDCEYTGKWVGDHYGDEGLTRIGGQQVVCSGVTLGRQVAILAYLEATCDEISKGLFNSAFKINGDQGIHNWIIRTHNNGIDCLLTPTGHNLIATLNLADIETYYRLDEHRGLLTKESVPVAIVHQYDKKVAIREWCLKRWTGPQEQT